MTSMSFLSMISFVGYAVEVVGIAVILMGISAASLRYIRRNMLSSHTDLYHNFRREMGRAMLVGLEFLVAGDIIRTVVVTDTITGVASLGLVVLIRTVLVFTIHLEVEGHWPWQAPREGG